MRIVIDTDILWNPAALRELAERPEDLVVPAIVFTERARQYARRGWPVSNLWRDLAALQFVVEDFRPEHGLRFAARLTNDRDWKRLARDAMIAGHLEEGDVLWTGNVKDFLALGVAREQLKRV